MVMQWLVWDTQIPCLKPLADVLNLGQVRSLSTWDYVNKMTIK